MWYSGFRNNVDPYVDPIFGTNMLPPYLAKKISGPSLKSEALSLNMKAAWASKILIYGCLHTRLHGVKAQNNP